MRGRRILMLAAAVAVGATGLAGAASGRQTASLVGFAVRGNPRAAITVKPGATVSFVARAVMRRGDLLLVVATRGSNPKLLGVARCSLSPCPGHWKETRAVADRFQAFLTRGSGKSFEILGRSRVIRVTWKAPPKPPPPPPPPPPTAAPGNFTGKTLNAPFNFTVTPDGLGITNLTIGELDYSCNPQNSLSLTSIGPLTQTFPVNRDGSFTITLTGPSAVNYQSKSFPTTGATITVTGQISGSIASGTVTGVLGYTGEGVTYSCSSGAVTWSGTRTG